MMHDHTETNHFTQLYECEHKHIIEEKNLVSIKVHDYYILKCPACGTEKLNCIGDNR